MMFRSAPALAAAFVGVMLSALSANFDLPPPMLAKRRFKMPSVK